MARAPVRIILAALTWFTCCLQIGLAQNEEPVVYKRPLSEWLATLKGDKTDKNRRAALIALGEIGLRSRKVVPAVALALRQDESATVREAAAQLLGRLAFKATDLLQDATGAVRVGLIEDRKQALEALMEALRADKVAKVRTASGTGLGRLGPDAAPAVAALAAALKDKDDTTRAAAAEALGRIGRDAGEAVPALLDCLKDKKADRFVRMFAAFALGRTEGDSAVVVPALSETLADPACPSDVRKAAAEALGQIGRSAADSVPILVSALTKEPTKQTVDIRRAAATALDRIHPEAKAVLPDLKAALKDDDKFVRSQILHLLGRLGNEGADAVPDVIQRLKDDQVLEVRLAAIEALGALGVNSKEVIEALTAASRSSVAAVRDAAKEALKKLPPEP
ncbi:MAG: HEAT repeat domain-containing protein [Gemmataceae bacterium]